MNKYCFINDKIIEEKNARISPHDLGILRGYGIFDFMVTTNQKPFLFDDHWQRLQKNAKELQLLLPITKTEFKKIIIKLLKKNELENAGVKTILTAGSSIDGFTPSEKPTFYILMYDINQCIFEKKLYQKGAKIITHQFTRPHPKNKTTTYIEAIKNQRKKNQRNAIEILYINNKTVLECATSNIFIIKNKTLITPKDDILQGVTRKKILQIAKKERIKTQERKVSLKQLLSADEVFITGSAKHILPIVKVDMTKIGDGKPGDITQKISHIYSDLFNNY